MSGLIGFQNADYNQEKILVELEVLFWELACMWLQDRWAFSRHVNIRKARC